MLKHKILWWLLMFLLLVGVVWLAGNNQGYVLIIRSPYRIQVSFNFLLIFIVLSFLGLHYCLRLINFLRRLPASKRSIKDSLHLKAGNAALLEGMHALAEGNFEKAEASAKLAQELIQNADLELLIEKITSQKNKQRLLAK